METTLTNNSLAFIGLCKEYCEMVENSANAERTDFVRSMLHILPRIYISAMDLRPGINDDYDAYMEPALDEDYYDSVRRNLEMLMGEEDVYLEVFEEDMKYSDTPVSASVAEGLADIFQVCYNFLHTILDATDAVIDTAISAIKEDFHTYWSATLCNVLRALNHIYNTTTE